MKRDTESRTPNALTPGPSPGYTEVILGFRWPLCGTEQVARKTRRQCQAGGQRIEGAQHRGAVPR